MKFNKTLQRAVAVTTIPATWIDYKGLKKLLSEIKTHSPKGGGSAASAAAAGATSAGATTAAAVSGMSEAARHQLLLGCPDTCAFFAQVMCELHKVSCFYIQCEGQLVSRYEGCLEKLHAFFVNHWVPPVGSAAAGAGVPTAGEEWSPTAKDHLPAIMGVLLSLTSELIQLENFSVLCYAGFGKILKKHDKLTGHTTCSPFMKAHVNPQEFASFTRLRQMLAGVERTYKLLTRLFKIPGDAMALSSREAQHFKVLGMVRTESRVGDLVEGNSDEEEDGPSGGGGGGDGGGGVVGGGAGTAATGETGACGGVAVAATTLSAPAPPANSSSSSSSSSYSSSSSAGSHGTSPTSQGTFSGRSAAKRSRTGTQ